LVIGFSLLVLWPLAAVWLNFATARDLADDGAGFWSLVQDTLGLDRPLLPSPSQVALELWNSVTGFPVTSPRNLLLHAAYTSFAAMGGFVLAVAMGLSLAVVIVHNRLLDRALTPWLIVSQTIPVLAVAPMVIVVLGNIGFTGYAPKALIAGWLSFLPVSLAMVQGLRAADAMQMDLMRTYNASRWQVLLRLRWPISMAYLFPSLKLAAMLALVGTMVAELPTGGTPGLGARLLAGSYYGQMLQLWAALVMTSVLAILAIRLVGLAQSALARRRGGRL
jgi:NitT/TauT family transport system permease protein